MGVRVVNQAELPLSNIARELVGADRGGLGACILFIDAPPGGGPSPHTHPYEEVLILLEGEVTVVAGDREIVARAGDVVLIPADTPHAFTNTGDGPLRQIDIHLSPSFDTTWL
jgi:mannose-6-phosphate isomerase-like protein (cupin superfamily)